VLAPRERASTPRRAAAAIAEADEGWVKSSRGFRLEPLKLLFWRQLTAGARRRRCGRDGSRRKRADRDSETEDGMRSTRCSWIYAGKPTGNLLPARGMNAFGFDQLMRHPRGTHIGSCFCCLVPEVVC